MTSEFRNLSILAVAVLTLLAGLTQGCKGSAQENANIHYTVDMAAANKLWHSAAPAESPADLWTALVTVGETTLTAPTHLFGDVVKIIPYSSADNVTDADGRTFERGDQEVAKVFRPGQLGIALKMHRPQHRVVDLNNAEPSRIKEDFKLQDTHIGVVVGVEKAEHGEAGAIAVNNPQKYEKGRFGDADYSMIFLRPRLPEYVPEPLAAAYGENSLLALLGFNAVSDFPQDYNGGDPLGAKDPERLRHYVDRMAGAIAGDDEAVEWFKRDENLVYCAEIAFLALSAGVITPLTQSYMEPRVGAEVWAAFVDQIEIHNRGVDEFQETGGISPANTSRFLSLNKNKRVGMVRLRLPQEDLRPVAELSPNPEADARKMGFQPMTMSDMVRHFLRTHVPRQRLGEALAPVQGAVLAKMKPGLFESMAMDRMPDDDPRKMAVSALFDEIVEVVSVPYGSYEEFLAAIEPLLRQARQVTGPREGDEIGEGLFFPPSGFHMVAQGRQLGGLLGLGYEGHGAHASIVSRR